MSVKPFALSVKVIIRDDEGRILLLKRSMSSKGNPGKWELPGGKVDPGEGFEEALIREVAEETGLTISLSRVAGAAESETNQKRIAYLILEGRLEEGKVRLSPEHEEFRWVHPPELSAIDVSPQFRPILQTYLVHE